MNGFGECPLFFFVDDNEMFEDINSNYYWNNNYGKIVELSDVGCDARSPLSLSSPDAKPRDRIHLRTRDFHHEHLRNTQCSRGDSQTIKNGSSHTAKSWRKKSSNEKSGRRKSPLIRNIDEVESDSIRRESASKRRTRMRNNDDEYFVYEEAPLPAETPLDFTDSQNDFFAEEMYPPQRPTRSTRDRTNPKISQTEGRRSKLKADHIYERYRQKRRKLINELSLYEDAGFPLPRDSNFLYQDDKELKNCAVDKDSLSSLSKFSEFSISSESSKEYSGDNFTLRACEEEQNTFDLNKFENREKYKHVENSYVNPNLTRKTSSKECNEDSNKKLNHKYEPLKSKNNYKYESKISNHSVGINENKSKSELQEIENSDQAGKEQMSEKLRNLFNSYSVKREASLTKASKEDSKITLKSNDKRDEQGMDSVEGKKEDSSLASSNSTLSADKQKRKRSRLPIRIGGSMKTKLLRKNGKNTDEPKETDRQSEETRSIKARDSESPAKELLTNLNKNDLNKNEVRDVDKRHSSLEPSKLASESSKNCIKKDTVDEKARDDPKKSCEKNKQEEARSRGNFSSNWQEVHFQRRAVDLKVFNMAKAAREQRKREFAEYGFEDIQQDSKAEPKEILDIGISLVEKNFEMPRRNSAFDESQSNMRDIPGSRTISRRGSIYM